MTTVVAVAANGSVYMAADTCTNVYERAIIGGAQKIMRFPAGRGELLLGLAGNGGLGGCLLAELDVASVLGVDDDPQMRAHEVAMAVTRIAVEHGLVDDGKLDGTLLLGWRGRLWTLTHALAIPHPDGRAALGSGEGPAIGALDAFLECGVAPRLAVERAVQVAIVRDRYSEAPVQVEVLAGRGAGAS